MCVSQISTPQRLIGPCRPLCERVKNKCLFLLEKVCKPPGLKKPVTLHLFKKQIFVVQLSLATWSKLLEVPHLQQRPAHVHGGTQRNGQDLAYSTNIFANKPLDSEVEIGMKTFPTKFITSTFKLKPHLVLRSMTFFVLFGPTNLYQHMKGF